MAGAPDDMGPLAPEARAEDVAVDLTRPARRALAVLGVALAAIGVHLGMLATATPDLFGIDWYWGPATMPEALLASFAHLVLLGLITLGWLSRAPVRRGDLLVGLAALAVGVGYAEVAREHVIYGDWGDFLEAAQATVEHRPWPIRYVYPPLLASVLAQIIELAGPRLALGGLLLASQLSIPAFHLLACRTLGLLGLSRTLAALLVTPALVVNVAVLRNLVYAQVNLLLLDLALGAVVLAGSRPLRSGLLLALGAHLKVVPLLLAPPFLLLRSRWRWVAGFLLGLAGVAAWTSAIDGPHRYGEFLDHLAAWQPSELRSSSLFGFLTETTRITGWPLHAERAFGVWRVLVGGAVTWLAVRAVRTGRFARIDDERHARVVDAVVPLLFLWPVWAPTVWIHHLTALILPALVAFTQLRSRRGLWVFALAWSGMYLLPVFDLYAWSYLRMLAWWTMLGLFAAVVHAPAGPRWTAEAERRLDRAWRALTEAAG